MKCRSFPSKETSLFGHNSCFPISFQGACSCGVSSHTPSRNCEGFRVTGNSVEQSCGSPEVLMFDVANCVCNYIEDVHNCPEICPDPGELKKILSQTAYYL